MLKFHSYQKMCISTICPQNWLRFATSLQLRESSSRVKIGLGGAQSFSIGARNNNNNVQCQRNVRPISCCASLLHARRTVEIPPLVFSVVKYQIKKYSVVRKGQILDSLETSFGLEEPLEKPSKLRITRTKCCQTDNNKDPLEASFNLKEPREKASKSRRTRSKDSLDASFLLEEPLAKPSMSRKSGSKVGLTNLNKDSSDPSFPLGEPLRKPCNLRRTRSEDGRIDPNKDFLQESIGKATKSKKTRRKLDVTDSNEDSLDSAFHSVEPLEKTSKPRRTRSKLGLANPNMDSLDSAFPSVELLEKTSKPRRPRSKVGLANLNTDSLDTAFPSVEPLEKSSKPRRTRSKVGLTNPNTDMLCVSSLLDEPVGKGTKSKDNRRKLDVTDSIEARNLELIENPSNSKRTRSKFHLTYPNKDLFSTSSLSKELVEKATKFKKARRKLDVINSNEVFCRMEFDGASKGNPGKAGAGAVLRNQDGSVICQLKEGVGRATNNVAEYRAIILGLKVALNKGFQRIHVEGDSKLVCMQIQDLWKISSQNIAELSKEAKELKSKFKEFHIRHIYRESNAEADGLANAAVELKNGEIKNVMASFQLDNPLEKASNLRRKRSKVDEVDPKKKLVKTSLPLEGPPEKQSKPGRTSLNDGLRDTNKVFYRLEFDGASKGNPGKAGAGAVLRNQDGSVICQLKEGVGRATNNVAEYRAIILGLKVALNKGIQRIHVEGDSKLVCMQIQDLWKISSQNIAELSKEAKELKSKFKEFHIRHIYRESNSEADALANAAVELKNGEIKKVMASFLSDNHLEKASNSRRERSNVDEVNPKKKLVKASFPLEKPLEKPSKSGRTSCSDGLLDANKVFYRLEFDGASKGNPGKAGAGAVLRDQDGLVVCKLKEDVGIATNNVAEYHAVILGLKVALRKGIQRIHVQGDSKLVCMLVQDLWKVKSQNIAALNMEARKLMSKFKEFHISHIYRELNAEANDLANAAIELQSGE